VEALSWQIASLKRSQTGSGLGKALRLKPFRIELRARESQQYRERLEEMDRLAHQRADQFKAVINAEATRQRQMQEAEIAFPFRRALQEEILRLNEETARRKNAIIVHYRDEIVSIQLRLAALEATQKNTLLRPATLAQDLGKLKAKLADLERDRKKEIERIEAGRLAEQKRLEKESRQKEDAAVEAYRKRQSAESPVLNGDGQGDREALPNPFVLPPLRAAPEPSFERWPSQDFTAEARKTRQTLLQELKAQQARLLDIIAQDVRLCLQRASREKRLGIMTGTHRPPSYPDVTALVASYLKTPSQMGEGGA